MKNDQKTLWLRSFNETDFDRLISWVPDANALMQFAGPVFSFPLTGSQLLKYIADHNRRAFVVMLGQAAVGHAEIQTESAGVSRLCRILIGDPAMRGRGFGSALTILLMDEVFSDPAVNELILHVFDWNIAAVQAYKKAGFLIDPAFSNTRKIGNEEWRLIRMKILRDACKRLGS
jgi:RimJ/RimL family protein N-acetyltransferase